MNGTKDPSAKEVMTRAEIEALADSREKIGLMLIVIGALSLGVALAINWKDPYPSDRTSGVLFLLIIVAAACVTIGMGFITAADARRSVQLREAEAAEEAALNHSLVGTKLELFRRELGDMPDPERRAVLRYLNTQYK